MIETCFHGNRLLVTVMVIFGLFLCDITLKAQNTVGIGTPSPNANAVLDLVSPGGNQGLLVPRITTSQRQSMTASLSSAETGLIVFDTELKQFFHWVDTVWVVGLGSFSDIAGGDLTGSYPNPTLRADVVNSTTIQDGSITGPDLSNSSVTLAKIDAEGNTNAVLGTDGGGNPVWESKSNFLANSLPDGNIIVGDAANTAQPRAVSGDISLANDGTVTISDNSITSAKILDESITSTDIGTDAVTSDEIASGAVGSDEIADGSILTTDIAGDAITSAQIADGTIATEDIESAGNNKVLITTAAGTVFWENISLFETSTLPEGSIFVGDVSNTAAPLNARGSGRILIGDGTSVQSLSVNGDISLSAAGDAQINAGVVGSMEITDNSLTRDDIAPNAIESAELADNAVDNGAIQDNAVSTTKIQDNAIVGQKISSDAITSSKIADGTIVTTDIADDAVSTAKIDGAGNADAVLTTTAGGNPQWETRSNFGTSSLPNANLFVGDAAGVSQARPVSGDVTLSNSGNIQINGDVIGTGEVIDNSLTVDDIGPNSIEASELADNAVDTGALQSNAVVTSKINDDAVTIAKIDGGGNNDALLTTDGAGNPQWEAKSGLDVDPTNEIQDLSLTGNTLDLTGDATTVDLSGYLDNTDNQDLTNVLGQGNSAGGTSITNVADPSNAQDVATKNYVDALDAADADGDLTNEIQDLSLTGNTLDLTGDATTVDLSGYLDNTDNQDLTNVLGQGNSAGGISITNVADPSNAQDVATKNYVDNIIISGANLASNSISSNNIINGSITSADIGNGEVSTSDMADDAINSAKIADLSIGNSDISNTANIGSSKLQSNVMLEGEDVSLLNNDAGYLSSVSSSEITDGTVVDADISNTANIASSKLQSTVMLEGEDISLLNNDAGYLSSVSSSEITDGTVVDADISNTANIASSKLQSTVMLEGEDISLLNNDAGYLSSVSSSEITDGSIVNADVNAGAAIDGSKINPDFGTQNIQTTGTINTGAATVSSLTVSDMAGATDTYTGDGAVNSFTISAAGAFSSSDIRLKEGIQGIPQALDKINQVEGRSYIFKNDRNKQLHYGVIAQDLQKLFPHLVQENENGYLAVNYLELIPVLIEALKEQQDTIEQLSLALKQRKELNIQLKAGLEKQQQLVRAQQFVLNQMQIDRAAMQKDIEEIKRTLGLEAKK